jgi:hypothetical protein
MESSPVTSKLARTSLTLGILGWILYFSQWCFDLTLGLLLAIATAGSSAVCSTVLDFLPFVLWLIGILTGHVALGQIKQTGITGRRQATWGLVLSYTGMFFTILLIAIIVALLTMGVGVGVLDKLLPSFPKH